MTSFLVWYTGNLLFNVMDHKMYLLAVSSYKGDPVSSQWR